MISHSIPLLLCLLFLPHFISHATTLPSPDSLLQCLHNHSIPPSLIFTPKSSNFTPTLLSSAQNPRIIFDNHSPKPFLVITPTQASHVQAAVICSKNLNFQLRTRSGGHDYEGLSYFSTFGPFLILDLFNLRSISFNVDNTVWVQSGATLGELYFSIASKNRTLAFPAGFCPTVGVGGHIAGGGIGTIMRKHGIAADHVVDIHMVNANGEILDRESMGEDLFWALRGGGAASFGVILAYKIKLVQVPPNVTVLSKTLTLPQGATKAMAKWQQVAYKADNRLYISALLSTVGGTAEVIFSGLFLGEMPELLLIMEQSLPELQVAGSDCKEMSWIESQIVFSSFPAPNINNDLPLSFLLDRSPRALNLSFKVKSDIVREPIVKQSWEKIWKYALKGDELLLILIEPLGGKVAEIAETETPFPHRNGSKFVMQHIVGWIGEGRKEAKKHIDWFRGFYKFMAPFVSENPRAAYLNFRDLDLGKNTEGVVSYDKAQVWGKKYYNVNFKRLAYVKSKTDPDNFFKNEQSIPPLFY
ncbi:berberine bridge enzyme-like 23 [Phalaenopsis equestris]|uniref:berberine bridge enzyme-like 23 n=1 Tax=Phalaenopsis equestris TaxID=78828 RepID=UPI0009E3B93F|nr:berberine bridge enzyme-like 23 [Phalaenopsis equestris]